MNPLQMTQEDYRYASEDNEGYCMACGEPAYGVEPDARGYECEACGEKEVYGLEELMLMGLIEFVEED